MSKEIKIVILSDGPKHTRFIGMHLPVPSIIEHMHCHLDAGFIIVATNAGMDVDAAQETGMDRMERLAIQAIVERIKREYPDQPIIELMHHDDVLIAELLQRIPREVPANMFILEQMLARESEDMHLAYLVDLFSRKQELCTIPYLAPQMKKRAHKVLLPYYIRPPTRPFSISNNCQTKSRGMCIRPDSFGGSPDGTLLPSRIS